MIHQLNDLKRAVRSRETAATMRGVGGVGMVAGGGVSSPAVAPGGNATPLGMLPSSSPSFSSSSPRFGSTAAAGSGSSSSSGQQQQQQQQQQQLLSLLRWMHTPDWLRYVHWLDKWCEEIFYLLGRAVALVSEEEEEEQPLEESPSWRLRKKRVGLRARVEWVQSPDEV